MKSMLDIIRYSSLTYPLVVLNKIWCGSLKCYTSFLTYHISLHAKYLIAALRQ